MDLEYHLQYIEKIFCCTFDWAAKDFSKPVENFRASLCKYFTIKGGGLDQLDSKNGFAGRAETMKGKFQKLNFK